MRFVKTGRVGALAAVITLMAVLGLLTYAFGLDWVKPAKHMLVEEVVIEKNATTSDKSYVPTGSAVCSVMLLGAPLFILGFYSVEEPSIHDLAELDHYRKQVFVDVLFTLLKECEVIGAFFSGYVFRKYFSSYAQRDVEILFHGEANERKNNRDIVLATCFQGRAGLVYFMTLKTMLAVNGCMNLASVNCLIVSFKVGGYKSMLTNPFVIAGTIVTCQIVLVVAKAKTTQVVMKRKAQARDKLKQSGQTLEELKQHFPDHFVFDESNLVQTACQTPCQQWLEWLACLACGVPTAVCFIWRQFLTMKQLLSMGEENAIILFYVFLSLAQAYAYIRGIAYFFSTAVRTNEQITNGFKQVVVLKSTVEHHGHELTASMKRQVAELCRHSNTLASQAAGSDQEESSEESSNPMLDSQASGEVIMSLDQALSWHDQSSHKSFAPCTLDLSKTEDLLSWADLRNYVKTDLLDETMFIDIMVAGSLMYVLAFAIEGFYINPYLLLDQGARLRTKLALVMLACNVPLFMAVFVQAVNWCVALNDAFQQDASILLEVVSEMQVKQASEGKRAVADRDHIDLITTMRAKIQLEELQTIMGIAVTSTLRKTILISLAGTAGSAAWSCWRKFAQSQHQN